MLVFQREVLVLSQDFFFKSLPFPPITSLKNPKLVGEEIIEGERCVHLTVEASTKNKFWHFWIIKNKKLIKKVKLELQSDDVVILFEKIEPNIEISNSIFYDGFLKRNSEKKQ